MCCSPTIRLERIQEAPIDDRHLRSKDIQQGIEQQSPSISVHLSTGNCAKGTRDDVGQGAELELRHSGQRHVVKIRAVGEVELLEVVAPVQDGLLSLLMNLSLDVGLQEADGARGLFADDGDVPL